MVSYLSNQEVLKPSITQTYEDDNAVTGLLSSKCPQCSANVWSKQCPPLKRGARGGGGGVASRMYCLTINENWDGYIDAPDICSEERNALF